MSQPSGHCWPAIFFTRTLPSAVALVEKSRTCGESPRGTPIASGLVESRGAVPQCGAPPAWSSWAAKVSSVAGFSVGMVDWVVDRLNESQEWEGEAPAEP